MSWPFIVTSIMCGVTFYTRLCGKRSFSQVATAGYMHLAYTLGLWRNKDSSICTTTPGPPRVIVIPKSLVEQTSLSHRYTSTAVPTSTSAAALASVTGYSCAHQKMSISHFCKGSLDFEKKLPSLIDVLVLQVVHLHLTPSDISFLTLSTMATPHLYGKS